jgi:hypothetical protein
VIPEIEASAAFKDGGLIDITFDGGYPPFTYTGNSFANSTIVAPNATTSIADASAGETLFGHTVHDEPTGPNTPLVKAHGQELYPGPRFNSYVDRPSNCVQQDSPAQAGGHMHSRRRSARPRPTHGHGSDGWRRQLDDRR